MGLITVITPTYNRAQKLRMLFESLQMQTVKNFDWLIVDDGSTDNTEQIVDQFKEEALFSVQYIRKDNGGKHTALNVGIQEIDTELTFIVDSDDKVMPNGTQIIEQYYEKYKNEQRIGFFSFLRCNENHQVLIKMPKDEYIGNYVRERIKGNIAGDMAEVFLTHVLRKYRFPEFTGEKFLSEDVLWIQIGMDFDTVFINESIYECEYLPGGLTKNDKSHKFASPLGSMMRGKMLMKRACGLIINIKGAIIYNCYKCAVCADDILDCLAITQLREKLFIFLTKPLGLFYYMKWNKRAKQQRQ